MKPFPQRVHAWSLTGETSRPHEVERVLAILAGDQGNGLVQGR